MLQAVASFSESHKTGKAFGYTNSLNQNSNKPTGTSTNIEVKRASRHVCAGPHIQRLEGWSGAGWALEGKVTDTSSTGVGILVSRRTWSSHITIELIVTGTRTSYDKV